MSTAEVKNQLGKMVLETIEQTLNTMLDAEADEITQAHKYESTENRADTRAESRAAAVEAYVGARAKKRKAVER